MNNIMNILKRSSKRYGGWKIVWPTEKVNVLYQSVWNYFNQPEAIEVTSEGMDIYIYISREDL